MRNLKIGRLNLLLFLWILILSAFVTSAHCQTFGGYAVEIHDGDTIKFRANNGQFYQVRIRSIDAPELAQPFGEDCTNLLRAKIFGQQLRVWLPTTDYYGRRLGEIYLLDNTDVALWMIENGCAWSWKETTEKRDAYRSAQGTAQMSHVGLWTQTEPERPDKYRKRMRGAEEN